MADPNFVPPDFAEYFSFPLDHIRFDLILGSFVAPRISRKMDLEILKEILIVFDHLCDVQGMQVWEQDSNNLAQAAFGRQRSEEDLR